MDCLSSLSACVAKLLKQPKRFHDAEEINNRDHLEGLQVIHEESNNPFHVKRTRTQQVTIYQTGNRNCKKQPSIPDTQKERSKIHLPNLFSSGDPVIKTSEQVFSFFGLGGGPVGFAGSDLGPVGLRNGPVEYYEIKIGPYGLSGGPVAWSGKKLGPDGLSGGPVAWPDEKLLEIDGLSGGPVCWSDEKLGPDGLSGGPVCWSGEKLGPDGLSGRPMLKADGEYSPRGLGGGPVSWVGVKFGHFGLSGNPF